MEILLTLRYQCHLSPYGDEVTLVGRVVVYGDEVTLVGSVTSVHMEMR